MALRKNFFLIKPAISKDEQTRVITQAEEIVHHRFIILSKKIKFGKKINWQTNFAGKSWPMEPYEEFRNNNYDFDSEKYIGDIKLPWELNKHLYFQELAKAYLVTQEEKYLREFIEQINDWIEKNPYEVGVNWTEGLIACHRATSWIIALDAFETELDPQLLKKIRNSLYEHALFIEKTYEFTSRASNHLIGELCAQILLSSRFPEFIDSQKRLDFAITNLEEELGKQVYPDGVDYEMSTSYQRVILEFLFLPLVLAKREKLKLPDSIWQKAEKMTEFMMHMTQPNGLLQPISDADGARVFVLGNDINDFRPHLALAAWLFGQPDFNYVSEEKIDQIACFLSKAELSELNKLKADPPKATSIAFKEGGYWISRQNWSRDSSSWLFFDCGHIGMGEWNKEIPVGVHGHSDTLNFGLAIGKETFLTDNGSYSYTTERPFHLYFRSSVAHNVALVDNQDQNLIDPKPWLARQHAKPQNAKHVFLKDIDYLRGEHTGYLRLKEKIVVKREILHFKDDGFIIIKDTFKGTGSHRITENFHLAPGLKIEKDNDGFIVKGKKRKLQISCHDAKVSTSLGRTNPVEGWYSPTYGTKEKSTVLKFSFSIKAPKSKYFVLSWGKKPANPEVIFQKTLAKLQLPRVLMLATNDLSADPGVQKEASSLVHSGFEVSVLTFTTENHRKFYSHAYNIDHFEFEPFSPFKNIRHQIGSFLIRIYYNSPRIMKLMNSLGKLKKKLRITTLFMIEYDTNEAIGNKPIVRESKPERNIIAKIFLGVNYFYDLNQKLSKAGIEKKPDIIHAHDFDTLLAGYLIKRKTGAKLIYDQGKSWYPKEILSSKVLTWVISLFNKRIANKVDAVISPEKTVSTQAEFVKKHHNGLLFNLGAMLKKKKNPPLLASRRNIVKLYADLMRKEQDE